VSRASRNPAACMERLYDSIPCAASASSFLRCPRWPETPR
jgi:hypothetical protein